MKKNVANLLSIMNAVCGLLVIIILIIDSSNVLFASLLIIAGGIIDYCDGKVAVHLNITSVLGKQIDSFADLITFGIAPIIVIVSKFHNYFFHDRIPIIVLAILIIYVISVMIRLAKFNICSERKYFIGLPSTISGMIIAFVVFISLISIIEVSVIELSVIVFILALLMNSNFKVKKIM